ncbi:unnamed protein product [Chilo suppressalis]|uniref:DUF229 domain containing protein n=1 Tax=Chilo suppressalis TaxID=168631 RepID=A0ABN8LAZ1_CHISP|nr:unnamed protein product [Chilo suppressalis]
MVATYYNTYNRRLVTSRPIISPKRMKQLFLIGIAFSTLYIFFHLKKNTEFGYSYYFCAKSRSGDDSCFESDTNGERFTIQTEGCSIPFLKPIDYSIKKFVERPDVPKCLSPLALLEHNSSHIWTKKQLNSSESSANIFCCYQSFYRPQSVDNVDEVIDDRVKYNDCIYFNDTIDVRHEFVKVNCSVGINTIEEYYVFALKKKFTVHNDHEEISKNATAYNILVLGIDSVSRLNFFRTMPNTVKFLLNRGAVDLSGYNKVGDNTFPNLIPLLLGLSDTEIMTTCLPHKDAKFDNCPFIWEWFKQAGFYTAFAEDSGWLGTFNYLKAGFSNTPTDYYTHTFINEAEKYAAKENFSIKLTPCLNDRYFYQVLLDYVEDITYALRHTRLFGLFWEVTMSHDELNYPMAMDHDYVKLFEKLEISGYLNDSIVFILSDHGIRWGDIRYTKQGRLEERLPFVFVLLPPSFKENFSAAYRNLKTNSKRLTTPYDIYSTLYDLTNLENVKNENIFHRSQQSYYRNRSISLFLPVPSNRTCELAAISDHWCTCHKRIVKSKINKVVWRAAKILVERLNARVSVHDNCANLSLVDVIEANEMITGKSEDEEIDNWRELMIVIKTTPGDGVFEATLRGFNDVGWTVMGTVSRLNLYGNQSYCVTDSLLKLYCYCN